MRVASDLDRVRRIPRDLSEGAGCSRLDELPREPLREAHALAVDLRTRVSQQVARVGGLAEVDADLLEESVRVRLDQLEALVREHLDGSHGPCDEGNLLDDRVHARRLAGGTTSAASPRVRAHSLLLPAAARRLVRPSLPAGEAFRGGGRETTAPSRS